MENALNNWINYAVFTKMLHWVLQVFINFTATGKMQYVTTSKIHMADRYYPQGGKDFFRDAICHNFKNTHG